MCVTTKPLRLWSFVTAAKKKLGTQGRERATCHPCTIMGGGQKQLELSMISDPLSSGHRTGKGQFSFQSQRKAIPKNAQTTTQLHSSHMLVK